MLNLPPNNTPGVSVRLSPLPCYDRTAFSHEHDNLWLWSCLAHCHCVQSQQHCTKSILSPKLLFQPQDCIHLVWSNQLSSCWIFLFQQLKKFVFHYLYKTSRLVSAGCYVHNVAIDVWKLTGHGTVLFISQLDTAVLVMCIILLIVVLYCCVR